MASGTSHSYSGIPGITYSQRPDATPEAERSVLASVYRLILDCQIREKGGPVTAPNDYAKEFERRRLCRTKM
jgi:hypothetical protein